MITRGEPWPGASERLLAALAPVLHDARRIALRVRSLDDARQLDRVLRARWSTERLLELIQPLAGALRRHVLRLWGSRTDAERRDAEQDTFARRTAFAVRRLFGSLRRGAVQALRAAESLSETVGSWRAELPTRHGSLEQRLAEEITQRVHETEQRWHAQQARGVAARWRWRTQRDAAVRRKHRALEGTEYPHDEEPSEGRPGEPYGCRCWAEWIVA